MQQQQRWALAADAGEDAAERGIDPFRAKARIEVGEIGHLVASLRGQSGPVPDTKICENNPMHSTGIIIGATNPNDRLHILAG
ncbi:hypothetical protein TM239_05030 [Bradyrhizobium sp. TM239]|nr:hypothetical protein TM239_05030 [Bradyrhizobium sp. TM239]